MQLPYKDKPIQGVQFHLNRGMQFNKFSLAEQLQTCLCVFLRAATVTDIAFFLPVLKDYASRTMLDVMSNMGSLYAK